MPKPMADFSERAQFVLCFGARCQFCGKASPPTASKPANPWRAGPGPDLIRAIWPFKIRSCIECLVPKLRKVDVATQLPLVASLTLA